MKRSISVPLIFLGTLGGLTYCQQRCVIPANSIVQLKQDQYANLNDCQRDWGTEPENCQAPPTSPQVNDQKPLKGDLSDLFQAHSKQTTGRIGDVYAYDGPRYFWYRHENGGYPMTIQPDGTTRKVMGGHVTTSGAQFARNSISSQRSMPTDMTASSGVLRNGFGRIGCGSSSGS